MSRLLSIQEAFDVPLSEVSGLALQRAPGGAARLLAIGDESFELVSAELEGGSPRGAFARHDLSGLLRGPAKKGGSQWEAVAADGEGRVFVLEETPGHVLVLDPALDRLLAAITLCEDGPIAADWARGGNSRGEGLVPLANGHLLIVKEKDPPQLLEFGPRGARPAGVGPALTAPASFPLAGGARPEMVALARWDLAGGDLEDIEDLSDLAVGPDGSLYLVSDEARCLLRLDARLAPGGGPIAVLDRWELPKKVKKPEGLVVTAGGCPLVAVDREEEEKNLFLLGSVL